MTADDQASKKLSGIKKTVGDISKIAGGIVVSQGLLKIPSLFTGLTGAASQLEESLSKVDAVFGDSQQAVLDFAETSARSFGISERAALAAAGTYGNLFTAMGLTQEAASDMSVDLVALAADLASFHDIGTDVALEKLRSGLTGEIEPLKALGVFFTAATVKGRAMELGVIDVTGVVSEAAKVQARYSLVLEQTVTAQGDVAKTMGGAANQQKIFNARMDDHKTGIGTALLPALTATFISLNLLGDWLDKNGPVWSAWYDDNIRPAVESAQNAVAGLVSVIQSNFELIAPIIDLLIGPVKLFAQTWVDFTALLLALISGDFSRAWEKAKEIVGNFKTFFEDALNAVVDFLGAVGSRLLKLGTAAMNELLGGITVGWLAIRS